MAPPKARSTRTFPALIVAVLGLTVIAYSPAWRGPQIYDDMSSIRDNASITSLWPLSIPLSPPPGTAVSGRPIVNLSLAFNYWLNSTLAVDQSPDPAGPDKTISYHLFNLACHLACGLLLLGIVRRTLTGGRAGERWRARADATALVVATIWLLHPIQTEAVDYLIQRTEILVSLFLLLTLYASLRAWDAATPRARRRWLIASVVACALGMGSKEVMVGAPIIVVLYDRAFRTNSWRELLLPANGRRWYYAALAATWGLLAVLLSGHPRGVTVGTSEVLSPLEYLHTQGWAILHYLRLVAWPNAQSIDYSYRAAQHWRGVPGLLLMSLCGIVTLLAWTRANRWGWLAFLGAWFFILLAPSSSVVPILTELVAERRIYLAVGAVIVLAVVGMDAVRRRFFPSLQLSRAVQLAVASVGSIVLAALTWQRSALYAEPVKLWQDAVRKQPDNPRGWVNLGAVLAATVPPDHAEADSMFREGLREIHSIPTRS